MNPHLMMFCLGGGLFAILVFIHAFTDFVCQSHFEAMNKHNNAKVRALHCGIYTLGFLPILILLSVLGALTGWELFFSLNILFWSHFIEDTYYPVLLWAKYMRRPPCMTWRVKNLGNEFALVSEGTDLEEANPAFVWRANLLKEINAKLVSPKEAQSKLDRGGFMEFINEFLGKYLMIAIDQIIHFSFLIPIIWMVLN